MNALSGQPVDRPPVLAVLGAYGGRLTGTPLPELYTHADKYVAGQQAVIDTFGIDMALAPFDFSVIAEAFGGQVAFFDHQPPNMKRPGIATLAEALTCPLPDPHTTGRLPLILDATRKLSTLYHKTVPVFACLPGPASLPALMLGMETWLDAALFDEAAARAILKRSGTFWVAWANALLAAGADTLIVPEGMATEQITTRDLFFDQFFPHIHACFKQVNGPLVFHHNGGTIGHVLDLLPHLPDLAGIVIGSKTSLSEAREKVGPDLPLLGNIEALAFPNASPEQIHELTTHCLRAGKNTAPFILCTSGGDIPLSTPPENIHALVDAAKSFGTPPQPATKTDPVWVVCGILGAEINELHRRGEIDRDLLLLDSMLHMDPPKLEQTLIDIIEKENRPVILVYGDCCSGMVQLADRPGVTRVAGANCAQMLTGKKRFKELMHRDAFMLLPEWMPRWKEIIEQELGLEGETARDLFRDTRKEIVYLDTGVCPVPAGDIEACAAYIDLPVRTEHVELSHLLNALKRAEHESRTNTTHGSL